MKRQPMDNYIKDLEQKKAMPKDILTVLKGDGEYDAKLKEKGGRQEVRIKKGSAMAFMGYTDGKWEVPYGDLRIVREVIDKIKDR
jgi:hypothetical protein